jgi:hypothetical protein
MLWYYLEIHHDCFFTAAVVTVSLKNYDPSIHLSIHPSVYPSPLFVMTGDVGYIVISGPWSAEGCSEKAIEMITMLPSIYVPDHYLAYKFITC